MNIEEAIQIYGADAVFTAVSAGECEDFEPRKAMGLHIGTIDKAERISLTAYCSMTTEEKSSTSLGCQPGSLQAIHENA